MRILMVLAISLFSVCGWAQKSSLEVSQARIFVPMKGTNATGGYGVFKNTSKEKITVKIETAEGFKAVELHESLEKDGRMAMQKIESFDIQPGATFELKPGGHHIMLFDATKEMKVAGAVPVTFTVNNKAQTIEFKLEERVKKEEHHHHH